MADQGATLVQMKIWGGWKSNNNVPMEYIENSSSMKMNAANKLENVKDASSEKQPVEDTNPCTQPRQLSFTTTTFNRNFEPVHKYICTQNGIQSIPNHLSPSHLKPNRSKLSNSSSNNLSSNISIFGNCVTVSAAANEQESISKNNMKKREREESDNGELSEYESEEEGEGAKYSKQRPAPKRQRQKTVHYVFNVTTKNINITQ